LASGAHIGRKSKLVINFALHPEGNVNTTICAICGVNLATTNDHIPPKGIFPKPRPSDLITVPACAECNNGASQFDERFMVYLSMHAGIDQDETRRLFVNHMLKTVNHNTRLRRKLLGEAKEIELSTPSGEYAGKAHALNWDSEAHTKVIERITRGLYFHEYREILGNNAKVDVMWFEKPPDQIASITGSLPLRTVANGSFSYKHLRAEGVMPELSIWVFQFYGRHWAGAMTHPPGFNPVKRTTRPAP
jgi:hypothetical protein